MFRIVEVARSCCVVLNGKEYNLMWLIVAFDLPLENVSEKKDYRAFRKLLCTLGFVPFQKSLYFRWIKSGKRVKKIVSEVKLQAPAAGDILLLFLPDSTFQRTLHIHNGDLATVPTLPDEWQIF